MAGLYRVFEEQFDRMNKNLDRISELAGMLIATNKRLVGLEHEAWQSRLTTVADVNLTRRLASARRVPLQQMEW